MQNAQFNQEEGERGYNEGQGQMFGREGPHQNGAPQQANGTVGEVRQVPQTPTEPMGGVSEATAQAQMAAVNDWPPNLK